MTEKVFISLGTNIGDLEQNLCTALCEICRDCKLLSASSIYETEPWGMKEQQNFLNAMIWIEYDNEPIELLYYLQAIEENIGKNKGGKWGPRKIDLDIILFGNRIINTMDLIIPHKYLLFRDFFLIPLLEIAPNITYPVDGKRLSEYSERIPPQLKTIISKKEVNLWRDTITSL